MAAKSRSKLSVSSAAFRNDAANFGVLSGERAASEMRVYAK
jgi:hypothetical protein